jgi:hypothetical protein
VFVFFLSSCSKAGKTGKDLKILHKARQYLSIQELEDAGFKYFRASSFNLLFKSKYLYLFSKKDYRIVKFEDKKPLKVYQTKRGQAPGEFLNPHGLFFYAHDTLATFDLMKKSLLLFDLELNYLDERRTPALGLSLKKSGNGFLAFGNFGDKLFARMDNDFNVVETFVDVNKKVPFKNMLPQLYNVGQLLDEQTVAYSTWLYVNKDCKIDIFDINQKKVILSLKWEQPYPPLTEKDFNARRNWYGGGLIKKFKNCYVVENGFTKVVSMNPDILFHLLIFKENGELFFQQNKFPYHIIHSNDDSRIFLFDDDRGILYIDIEDILP